MCRLSEGLQNVPTACVLKIKSYPPLLATFQPDKRAPLLLIQFSAFYFLWAHKENS